MMKNLRVDSPRWRRFLPFIACFLVLFLSASAGWAAFGEDEEKPKPEFTRQGDRLTAKLIPRGKRTSIQIDFGVSGGRLQSVDTMDFAEAERPEVDRKDFRSGLFVVKVVGFPPGAEVEVAIASNYFTKSTGFWVFNPKATKAWAQVEAEQTRLAERVQELRVRVKDGGPLDSDGAANGEIVLVCGPMDSFWGYAIGTLFIRFFGVFLVLAVLQIGMNIASKTFRTIEARVTRAKVEAAAGVTTAAVAPEPYATPSPIDGGVAAAIAVGLHLYFSGQRQAERLELAGPEVSAWTVHGRGRIMADRSLVFDRANRSDSARFSR